MTQDFISTQTNHPQPRTSDNTGSEAQTGRKNQNTNKMKVSELYTELGKLIEQGQGERIILIERYYLGNYYDDIAGTFAEMDKYKTTLKPRERSKYIILK